jgi:hypothetical protein
MNLRTKAPLILGTAAACLLPIGAAVSFVVLREILIHAANNPRNPSGRSFSDSSFGRNLGYQKTGR